MNHSQHDREHEHEPPYWKGEEVVLEIPDPDDSEHRYHGRRGLVVGLAEDDLGDLPGIDHPEDSWLIDVLVADDGVVHCRPSDLRSRRIVSDR